MDRAFPAAIEEQGLEVLQSYNLISLDSALIVTRGDQLNLQKLRQQFPDAEIDWNDDLSASGVAPRLYAKNKIKWPDQGACLDEALKIPIGLIDGSIDQSHPAFAGQTILEKNFLRRTAADKSHATAIASILIGNAPDQGFDGLLSGAKIYNAVALRHAPNDEQLASTEATLRGLDWLMGQDIRLINVSLTGRKNRVLISGFEKATARGALVFAAAGNNGPEAPPVYPAALEGVFAVTAIDKNGKPYKAANIGDYIDLAAPGVDIWVAVPDKQGSYLSGTSYAVPYALAGAALLLTSNRNLSSDLIMKIFKAGGTILQAQCP